MQTDIISEMKLNVLEDNNTYIDMYYLGEPAVSYYIEDGEEKILFDAAYSDAFVSNARKMNIDLNSVDMIILSHGHNDHSGGLSFLAKRKNDYKLITHPASFAYREDENGLYIGAPFDARTAEKLFDVTYADKPLRVSKHLTYLGEIETVFDFEPRYAIGNIIEDKEKRPDYIFDDSALVYESDKGLFIITGCSHSGICNIIEQAKRVCSNDRIYGVIGGFHLFENNERLQKTISYLKDCDIELLYPCHCVSLSAKIEMAKTLNIREVGVGLELII